MSADTKQYGSDRTTCQVSYPVLDELHDRKQRGETINDVIKRSLGME